MRERHTSANRAYLATVLCTSAQIWICRNFAYAGNVRLRKFLPKNAQFSTKIPPINNQVHSLRKSPSFLLQEKTCLQKAGERSKKKHIYLINPKRRRSFSFHPVSSIIPLRVLRLKVSPGL